MNSSTVDVGAEGCILHLHNYKDNRGPYGVILVLTVQADLDLQV